MRLLLTKYANNELIIVIVPLMLSPLRQLLLVRDHRETDRFLSDSGVHLEQSHFQFRLVVFSSHLKSKVGHILTKTVY